jgi:hypothetical protein
MQPEPSTTSQNIPAPGNPLFPSPTSQHGQPRDDDLQDSLQPHPGELRGEPVPPPGGNAADATRSNATSDDGHAVETLLRGTDSSTPPPRDRISEYENARVKTPKKPSEGPLFEVVKSSRRPDDKSSAIAKLPNGEYSSSVIDSVHRQVLMHSRGLDPRHCPSLAKRSCRRISGFASLQ